MCTRKSDLKKIVVNVDIGSEIYLVSFLLNRVSSSTDYQLWWNSLE